MPLVTDVDHSAKEEISRKLHIFKNEVNVLHQLSQIIQDRRANPREGSYTASLFVSGEDRIIQKVGEEAVEVIIAAKGANRQRLIEETADLFYHTLVMLAEKGVQLEEVEEELRKRHSNSVGISP